MVYRTFGYCFICSLLFCLVFVASGEAQISKIQRKYATLTVTPSLLVEGNQTCVTVQPWVECSAWKVGVYDGGRLISEKPFALPAVPSSVWVDTVEFPLDGREYAVILEAQLEGNWTPVAEQAVTVLAGFYDKLSTIYRELESLEVQAAGKPKAVQPVWAALAFLEDLMERMKATDASAWDVESRLRTLEGYLSALKEGTDPFEGQTGYQLRGYRSPLTGEMQLFSLYIPEGYSADRAWPMVVMLHGAYSNHHLALRRVMGETNRPGEDDAAAKKSMPSLPDVPYVVVAPNGYETMSYHGYAEEDVWRVMEETQTLLNIDPNRVYLTGLSMGGGGTGKLGFRYPDRFAAIAPVCGYFGYANRGETHLKTEFEKKLYRSSHLSEIAENLLYVPTKFMHGDADGAVPVEESQKMHARLKELGYKTEIEIYPGVGHDVWDPGYDDARLFEWFGPFQRDPAPKKVIYKTGDSEGGLAYWIQIVDLQKIREIASVEAEFQDRQVSIHPKNVKRLALHFPPELVPVNAPVAVKIEDRLIYVGPYPGGDLSFQRQDFGWAFFEDTFVPRALPNRHGLDAARKAKHIYVFGSKGSDAETSEARALAVRKSQEGPLADVHWPVIDEAQLSGAEAAKTNIVYFSTWDGSAAVQEFASKLPVRKTEQGLEFGGRMIAADQAISFVYPHPLDPQKYVQVNLAASATGMKALRQFAIDSEPSYSRVPMTDFVCFDAQGNPLWGGLFDKDWNVEMMGDYPK